MGVGKILGPSYYRIVQAAAVSDLQVRTGKVLAGEIISSEIRKAGEKGGGGRGRYKVPSRRYSSRKISCSKRTQKVHRCSTPPPSPRLYINGNEDSSVINVVRKG